MKKTVKAYAKINLMLDILGTLENGYHDLFMLMQSVSLFDEIEAETDESGKITVTCSNPAIPTGEKNIAYKAAESFFSYTEIKNPGIKIHIKKNIPHAAGLAGGSADAAGVIEALRLISAPKLSDRDILNIGAPVGSDVPFCSLGGTMLAQYTGTALTYLPQLETEHIVIVKPPCSVSTGKAYAAFDSADRVRHLDKTGIFRAVMQGDRDGVYSRCDNVFEQFIDAGKNTDQNGDAHKRSKMLLHERKRSERVRNF